jgi:ubiquinone/menaquinone biosynthesis C-methylase UbiE
MSRDDPELDFAAVAEPWAWDEVASGYSDALAGPFAHYADHAIRLAGVAHGDRVLDVAAGPGTLTLRAARITTVDALDFSAGMLAQLEARADAEARPRLRLHQGDGQALPFEDARFDRAFSMFGLFLFPDRAKGFSELARVVRPGGSAVVSSWQPQDHSPALRVINAELQAASGAASEDPAPAPLSDPVTFATEMRAGGFTEVEVHEATHAWEVPSLDALWRGMERAHVGLAIARRQLPPAHYADLCHRIPSRLDAELGEGPQQLVMPAWLALGRR